MKKMYLTIAAVSMLGTFAAAQTPAVNPTVATVDHCMVSLEPISGQSQVPAQEAGVLKDIKVREGQQVRAGDVLVQIDDAQAQEQLKNARAEFKAAEVKAKNDIELRYAKKAADVAEFTYLKQKQSDDMVHGAVTEVDLQKYKLDWEKSRPANRAGGKKSDSRRLYRGSQKSRGRAGRGKRPPPSDSSRPSTASCRNRSQPGRMGQARRFRASHLADGSA